MYKVATNVARLCGAPVEDLLQEGFLGVMRAYELYDPKRSAFLTYAQHWIKMAMYSFAYRTQYLLDVPEDFHVIYSKYQRLQREAKKKMTLKQVAKKLGVTESRLKRLLAVVKGMRGSISLETMLEEAPGIELHTVDAKTATPFEDTILNGMVNPTLRLAKETLTPEEFFVVSHLLGLQDPTPKTLSWVGKILGVTKERVRQIKNAALDKVKVKLEEQDV